jgi:hypothetical protein
MGVQLINIMSLFTGRKLTCFTLYGRRFTSMIMSAALNTEIVLLVTVLVSESIKVSREL